MGFFIYKGLDNFAQGNRIVSVKGLAEKEVMANKVSWPIAFTDIGNNLPTVYTNISKNNEIIVAFLEGKGIPKEEISISAPIVVDLGADRYNRDNYVYRYNVTSVITVTSNNVTKVQELILQQSELLKKGIPINSSDYRFQIDYSFTELNKIKPQMIEEATNNARAAAKKFADDSKSKVGKIKRANQGQFSITNRDNNTPHIKTVRVVTSIDYFLK